MKIKKALWASLALTPAAIIPLSTATSCSQAWGFKTPLSIGTSLKGGSLDPFKNFSELEDAVDLDQKPIVDQLQSNYAVDTKNNGMYGYSLPQKWNSDTVYGPETPDLVDWDKGAFVEGNAGWYDYSSSDFVKSSTRTGTRKSDKVKVAETIYSYRNNTLSSTIQMVGLIGSTISSLMNYALQYQGTQIGTEYASASETTTNLATSWGGNITHGEKAAEANRQFYESVFAANAMSGTGKYNAVLHPTHVEFSFNENTFPIVSYAAKDGKIAGVNNKTLMLLNGVEDTRPGKITQNKHWTSVTADQEESVTDIRTGKTTKNKYKVYTYTNVPVIVDFSSLTKTFVNPTKNDSYIVSDFYSESKTITDTIGTSWQDSLPKFSTYSADTKPSYNAYTYKVSTDEPKTITYAGATVDERIKDKVSRNSFIVLMNYAYKEYQEVNGSTDRDDCFPLDRVTMTGISTIFPAFLLDESVKLGETTFFKLVSTDSTMTGRGYIIDSDKVNKYNNLLNELFKRSSGQGLVTEANKLNDTSKQLLKLLSFVFGDETGSVDTSKIITTYKL